VADNLPSTGADLLLEQPTLEDGAALWRIARDSRTLDLNSSYSYLLWCRDFARTSVVARVGGRACGFVTGYLRPEAPDTLLVWQVAVDAEARGQRLARRMLDELVDRPALQSVDWLETTVTADNAASIALFTGFARDRGAELSRNMLFSATQFPDGHDGELLFRIGPLRS
jgi:diaminobutyrate acetyltransferase